MYKLLTKDGMAKRGEFETVHGTIQTPVFMNVGTVGAIKGAVSTDDLRTIGTQVELSNTYHLHVRTGDKLIKEFGGLHKFMGWDKPILTDSHILKQQIKYSYCSHSFHHYYRSWNNNRVMSSMNYDLDIFSLSVYGLLWLCNRWSWFKCCFKIWEVVLKV